MVHCLSLVFTISSSPSPSSSFRCSCSFHTGDPAAATKRLVLIHERWFKPEEATLKEHWIRALEHGLKRDYGELSDEVARFKDVKIDFVYYGDLVRNPATLVLSTFNAPGQHFERP